MQFVMENEEMRGAKRQIIIKLIIDNSKEMHAPKISTETNGTVKRHI